MYPVLFRIGGFEITSFGAMVAVGALVGLWLFRRELLRSRLPESAVDAAVAGLAGGIAGAKLLWVFEHLGEEPFTVIALQPRRPELVRRLRRRASRRLRGDARGSGCRRLRCSPRRRRRSRSGMRSAASAVSWSATTTAARPRCRGAWRSPKACRRRPSRCTRRNSTKRPRWCRSRCCCCTRAVPATPDRRVLGLYLVLAGAVRFAIEFIRIDVRVLGILSVAHLASLAAVAAGLHAARSPDLRVRRRR